MKSNAFGKNLTTVLAAVAFLAIILILTYLFVNGSLKN